MYLNELRAHIFCEWMAYLHNDAIVLNGVGQDMSSGSLIHALIINNPGLVANSPYLFFARRLVRQFGWKEIECPGIEYQNRLGAALSFWVVVMHSHWMACKIVSYEKHCLFNHILYLRMFVLKSKCFFPHPAHLPLNVLSSFASCSRHLDFASWTVKKHPFPIFYLFSVWIMN